MELLLLYRNSCPRCDKSLRDSMFELKYLKKERGIFLIEGYILLELLTIIFIEENIRVTLYTVKREIHAIPFDQWFFLPLSCFSISKKLNAKNRNWRFELICEGVEGRKTKNKARQLGKKHTLHLSRYLSYRPFDPAPQSLFETFSVQRASMRGGGGRPFASVAYSWITHPPKRRGWKITRKIRWSKAFLSLSIN